MVEKRRAHFQRVCHGRDVHLWEERVGQVGMDVGIQYGVEEVVRICLAKPFEDEFFRVGIRNPFCKRPGVEDLLRLPVEMPKETEVPYGGREGERLKQTFRDPQGTEIGRSSRL